MSCLHTNTTVIDSRKRDGIVRRRECIKCKIRFTTYEFSEEEMEQIRKDMRTIKAVKLFLKKIDNINGYEM